MAIIKQATATNKIEGTALRQFKIDEASSQHIVSLLCSAYARPQFSSLREVLQNALDSAPGEKVSVTMPTTANPNLVVRDYGPGMSTSEFVEMIGNIGASSKRGDATRAGSLGIGSIAPLSVAESMSMASFQHGQLTLARIFKLDDGTLSYSVSDPVPAPRRESDGMEVTVPYPPDMHDALREGLDVFRFSPAICSRLIVDGSPIAPNHIVLEDSVKVGAHEVTFRVMEGQTEVLSGALVLLNDLPMAASFDRFPDLKNFETYLSYRETNDKRRNPYAGTTLVIDVPASAGLSFPPSREVVAATRLNAAFLANAVSRYFELGCKALSEKGLHVGCEAAIVMRWQALAAEKRKELGDLRIPLEKELNATSKYLRVELTMAHGYRKGYVPNAVLHPRLPASLRPRSLETRWFTQRRSYKRVFSMQTAGCVPIDVDDEAKGFKFPWASGDAFIAVTWDKLESEFGGDWSKVMSRDVKYKRAMYELTRKDVPANEREYGSKRVLLLAEPLPDDHPMKAHATEVELGTWLDSVQIPEDNPYFKVENEEENEEQLEDGSVLLKGEKVRHPRPFIGRDGASHKLGLPKQKPFVYLEILRDNYTRANLKDHPTLNLGSWPRENDWAALIKFTEDSGLCDGLDVVCLRPAEVKNIKRQKARLADVIAEAAEAWYDGLDEAERKWIPPALFRTVVKRKAPRMEKMLERFHDEGLGRDGKALAELLHGWDPAPSDQAERFVNAYAKGLSGNCAFTSVYDDALDPTDSRKLTSGAAKKLQKDLYACGIPVSWMLRPARLLRVWVSSKTPLARFFRIVASLDGDRGSSWHLTSHGWLGLNGALTEAGNPLETSMRSSFEIAKLLAPPP